MKLSSQAKSDLKALAVTFAIVAIIVLLIIMLGPHK